MVQSEVFLLNVDVRDEHSLLKYGEIPLAVDV